MDITRIRVVAQVQPSSHLNGFAEPHILIHHDEEEPTLTLENANDLNYDRDLLKSEYRLSRCVSNFDYSTEVEYLANTALDGYDAAAIFMSASTTDTYRKRQEVIHGLLTDLDNRMETLNRLKERHGHPPIKIEFAYLGITDDGCYDLRTHRPLKNSQVLELGLVASMKSVKSAKHVWDKIKSGSKFPSILGVRLSDESKLLGTLTIADLLQPWSQTDSSIRYSFKKLLDAVDRRVEDGFEGFIPIETSVLTKLLGSYFCGLGKGTIFIQIDEYPRESLDATLNALNVSHKLYNIRSIATRNEIDTSKHSYRKAENEKKQLLEEKHALEKSIQAMRQGYQEEELRAQKQSQTALNLQQQRIEELNNQLKLALEKEEEYKKTISSDELHAIEMNFLASSSEYLNIKLEKEIQEYKVEAEKSDYIITMLKIKLADMRQQLQGMQHHTEQLSTEAQSEMKEAMKLLDDELSEARSANDELEKEVEKLKKDLAKQKDEMKKRKEELEKQKEVLKTRENEIKEQITYFSTREKALRADLDFVTGHADKLVEENETLKMFVDKFERKNDQLKKKLAEANHDERWRLGDEERKIYEDVIEQWKTRAQNAEKKLGTRKIQESEESQEEAEQSPSSRIPKRISAINADMFDLQRRSVREEADIEGEHDIRYRVLPKRGVKKVQSYSLKEMFEDISEQENDFEPEVPVKKKVDPPPTQRSKPAAKGKEKEEPPTTDPPKRRRGRPRKHKPEDQNPAEKGPSRPAVTSKEPKRDENREHNRKENREHNRKENRELNRKENEEPNRDKNEEPNRDENEEPNRDESKEPSLEPEGGDAQSPVMEYEVELKMPEDTPEEEEEQDVKQTEMAPPRKKRKLRNTKRTIDYDTEFLSPLSKVNNTLNHEA